MENKNLPNSINSTESRAEEQNIKKLDASQFRSQILSQIKADLDENGSDPVGGMFLKAPDWERDIL